MNETEFKEIFQSYYRHPRPDRIPDALEWYATSPTGQNRAGSALSYFFARIAHLQPAVIDGYKTVLRRTSGPGRVFVSSVLDLVARCPTSDSLRSAHRETVAEQETAVRMILTRHTDRARRGMSNALTTLEMDCLWAEFVITGKASVVLPIIEVLEWPDLIRARLTGWLQSRSRVLPAWLLRWRRKRVMERARRAAGIVCDTTYTRVETPDDVDCFVTLDDSLQASRERFEALRAALPFQLVNEELTYVGVKATAKWSLVSNAVQHPAILELCEEHVKGRRGRARMALLEIIGGAECARRNYDAAVRAFREYLDLNPTREGMKKQLLMATSELNSSLPPF